MVFSTSFFKVLKNFFQFFLVFFFKLSLLFQVVEEDIASVILFY